MSGLIRSRSRRNSEPDTFLDNPPFPLAGAAFGLIAITNVASALTMLFAM